MLWVVDKVIALGRYLWSRPRPKPKELRPKANVYREVLVGPDFVSAGYFAALFRFVNRTPTMPCAVEEIWLHVPGFSRCNSQERGAMPIQFPDYPDESVLKLPVELKVAPVRGWRFFRLAPGYVPKGDMKGELRFKAINAKMEPLQVTIAAAAINLSAETLKGEEVDRDVPSAFVSYSWDDQEHKNWVRELSTRLRGDGIEVILDQWHAVPGEQLPEFMEKAVRENQYVMIVCTPKYKQRSDGRVGGVGYEGDIITAEVMAERDNGKFIPILRRGEWNEAAPNWVLGKIYIDLRKDPYSGTEYQKLVKTLLGELPQAPPVGPGDDLASSKPVSINGPRSGGFEPIETLAVAADEVGTPTATPTTYDELMATIRNSSSADWLYNARKGIHTFRADLAIRIEERRDEQYPGPFKEAWATEFPDPEARMMCYDIYRDASLVETFYLVEVDGFRATLPMPISPKVKVVPLDKYQLARTVDRQGTLEDYMQRAGLTVEGQV